MTRNKQIRAVLLAALMVFSVFAGTVALSGSAAADASDISLNGTTAGTAVTVEKSASGSTTVSASVTDGATDDGANVYVWVDINNNGVLNTGEPNASATSSDGSTVDVGDIDVSDVSDGTYDVNAIEADSLAAANSADPSSDTEIDNGLTVQTAEGPEIFSATHFTSTDNGDVLELSFSEEVDLSGATFTVYQDETDVTSTVVDSAGVIENNANGQVLIQTTDIYTGDIEVKIEGVTDTSGNALDEGLDSDGNITVDVATVTVDTSNADSTTNAYQGENVVLTNGDVDTNIQIESDESQDGDEGFFRAGSTGSSSEVFVFNTTTRQTERYNVSIAGTAAGKVQVRDLGLDVTVDDLNVTDEEVIEGTVSANAGGRDIEVRVIDEDDDEVETDNLPISATTNGQGEYDFEIDVQEEDLDGGDYTLEVVDQASGVTVVSDTVTVREAEEGQTNFAENVVTDQRGDVVAIPVTLDSTDFATVTIGTADQGYTANVTVEDGNDDGEVIVLFDTSKSTLSGDSSTTVNQVFDVDDSDDDVVTVTEDSASSSGVTQATSDLIDAGDYDLEVTAGKDSSANAENVATLVLEEGGVESVNVWTLPQSESVGDIDDVTEAIEDGNLTQTDSVAFGDKVVLQITAGGLEGTLDAQGDETITQKFFNGSYEDQVYVLTVNQTAPGPNRDPKILNLSGDSTTSVLADSDNDTYFVVFDSEDVTAVRDENDNGIVDDEDTTSAAPEDDDAWDVNFTMKEDTLNDAVALVDDDSSAQTAYENVEGEHDTDADPINVTNAEDQVISGTSTTAPGTEITVRIRSAGDTQPRFLKTATVFVSENGTWDASFDFSEQNLGDTFTVDVEGGAADDVEDIDGNVVESVGEEETTTEETTEETTTEETTEETTTEATTTEEETTTEAQTTEETATESQTPGFGVIVALVALVAAALLAIRRD
ncbi:MULTISPECIES: BGTF surface domain-containing protein [Haloferax]|uniref:PGF-CTERM sorting domain-containing protein n=4 Tax=Haloferax TaxID=2251 RepID=A0A6G1Z225_9EURY|nr:MULTISPECIES: BGTF surface domain-containing protein [Haloferax]KAB1187801.1 PGF-CTERM sorting domain-containing protein [Haloferax sp. CBA1149]MRW80461.1 PGF-CTERM sorting domain-containing protein [Haloferax marinisediminis]